MAEPPPFKTVAKRRSRRSKIARTVRVRPSDPKDDDFEDLPVSLNSSEDGIYFVSQRETYYLGMRLLVTFPYSSPHDPINCEYLAEVMRVEKLPDGKTGVAVHLERTMRFGP